MSVKSSGCLWCLAMLLACVVAFDAAAQLPRTLSYQGVLKNADGSPVAGPVTLTVSLYESLTGGSAVWTEIHQDEPLASGVYSITLGKPKKGTPVPLTLAFDTPYYLQVTVGNVDMGRHELTSVPYALKAASLDGVTVNNGKVGVGGAPLTTLDVNGPLQVSSGTLPPRHSMKPVLMGGSALGDSGRLLFGSYGGWKFHIATREGASEAIKDLFTFHDQGSLGIRTTNPNGMLQMGDLAVKDASVFRFYDNRFALEGGPGDTYPMITLRDSAYQEAMYIGYGSKANKRIDVAASNGHAFQFRGNGDFFNISDYEAGVSLQAGPHPTLTKVMRLRPVWSTAGLALTGITNTLGLYVQASNGYVGVATTTPAYPLDVKGKIRGSNVAASDARWKTDIAPLDDALTKVTQLRGVTYRWKDAAQGAGTQIGVIAQEVEPVFPELVSTDSEGYKSVAYEQMVAPLIEAVKTLKAENDDLKRRVEALEAQIANQ